MAEQKVPWVELNDGGSIPAVGFGTYQLNGDAGAKTMEQALRAGYRLLDSAFNYENEGAVGRAARSADVSREEIRVVSKLPGRRHKYQQALATVEESLYRTGLDYVDLYLIHWPNPKTGLYVEAWQALIEARQRGLIRSIGVCNFLPEHVERLEAETGVLPSVNQIEMHPYFPQAEQRAYNTAKCIATQAWSPLGRAGSLLEDVTLQEIATAHQRTPGQIVLRWHHQLNVIPLPKATTEEQQRENLSLFDFELSTEEMNRIVDLSRADGRLANQDPAVYEEF